MVLCVGPKSLAMTLCALKLGIATQASWQLLINGYQGSYLGYIFECLSTEPFDIPSNVMMMLHTLCLVLNKP